jgi:hypothetical protein
MGFVDPTLDAPTTCGLEARWSPVVMPFRYEDAPIFAANHRPIDFPLIERMATATARSTVEGGFSSLFRTRVEPLDPSAANELINVCERIARNASNDSFASTYEETLPCAPPVVDQHRRETPAALRRSLQQFGREIACSGDETTVRNTIPCR